MDDLAKVLIFVCALFLLTVITIMVVTTNNTDDIESRLERLEAQYIPPEEFEK